LLLIFNQSVTGQQVPAPVVNFQRARKLVPPYRYVLASLDRRQQLSQSSNPPRRFSVGNDPFTANQPRQPTRNNQAQVTVHFTLNHDPPNHSGAPDPNGH
jgi:hypothetical protein